MAEAVELEVIFEPFTSGGDVQRLFLAAINLFHFVEEYERRTGSLQLPTER